MPRKFQCSANGRWGRTDVDCRQPRHLSRWWNPAVEDQYTDRVYRIGQTKTVQVHIPLAIHPRFAEHSFDRNLHALLERKRELSRGVLAPSVASAGDMASLFNTSVQV